MFSDTAKYATIMLLAGIGIPILAGLNARLGARIGSPTAAAVVVFSVALIVGIVAMLVTTGPKPLTQLTSQPPQLFMAGLFMAFYVLSVTFIAPKFGVGNAVFCVLLGQMISAAAIDHFGLIGATLRPLTLVRTLGLGVMASGLFLILKG
ncbi:MAG: DMT family transporter [Deltaproteobacteria bacterium]